MKAYYYREYVSNEGLLLQRVSLQWRLTVTESKSTSDGLLLERVILQWRLTITESKSAMKAYYYRE